MTDKPAAASVPASVDPPLMARVDHPGWRGCPGHGRHWYTLHGHVGVRLPRCSRCGFPKPGSDLTSDDWLTLYELGWRGLTDSERAWLADMKENGWPEGS